MARVIVRAVSQAVTTTGERGAKIAFHYHLSSWYPISGDLNGNSVRPQILTQTELSWSATSC